jgi:DNA-binding transcriptional ArsR family regulator
MKSTAIVKALGALAQESRLEVFRLLVKRGPDGYTPGDLSQKLAVPAPTLSFHLKELQHAGLVESRRDGRFLYYSANFETMHALVNFLTDNCCSLSDEACDTLCKPVNAPKRRRSA